MGVRVSFGSRLGSNRLFRVFEFTDGEVLNPFGIFYASDRVRIFKVQVISDITELYNK